MYRIKIKIWDKRVHRIVSAVKNMNCTKLAFRARQWEGRHQFVSLCDDNIIACFRAPRPRLLWAKNHDLWKIQTFTASQRRNDSSYGHKSQVMSYTVATLYPLIVPDNTDKCPATGASSSQFVLLIAHECHILKADYSCLWHATLDQCTCCSAFSARTSS